MTSSQAGGPIVVSWERFGPYHHARLRAAAQRLPIIGLEVSTVDRTYAWDRVEAAQGFERRTLFPDRDATQASVADHEAAIDRALAGRRPAAIAIPGWSARYALALLRWARRHQVPTILMSESTASDEPRMPHKEAVKRQILRMYDAALVGGRPQADYLVRLGFPRGRIFDGYDAIDNAHFAEGAVKSRRADNHCRQARDLPRRYFLTSGRFVPQKNLLLLLEAYVIYLQRAGDEPWSLVLLGDGELRTEIELRRSALGLEAHVVLPGFRQYDELPTWYGLASAFVHPATSEPWGLVVNEAMAAGLPVLVSRHCGCARDLVRDGLNGFAFDPRDPAGLAELMLNFAHGGTALDALGEASRMIIRDWDLDHFTDGLDQAGMMALQAPQVRWEPMGQLMLEWLARR